MPLLDPINHIMGNYQKNLTILPSNYIHNTTSKLNSMENSSYVEWLAYKKWKGSKFISLQAGGGTIVTPAFSTIDILFKNNFDTRLHYGKENFNKNINC